MNPLLDNFLVVAALAASAVYALFKLGPRALRRALLSRVAGWVARAPGWFGLRGLAVRLGAAAVKSSGSCGGCDNCGSEAGAAQASPPASASESASASGPEIRVPLASIGRRER
jgi:hypothetical protein